MATKTKDAPRGLDALPRLAAREEYATATAKLNDLVAHRAHIEAERAALPPDETANPVERAALILLDGEQAQIHRPHAEVAKNAEAAALAVGIAQQRCDRLALELGQQAAREVGAEHRQLFTAIIEAARALAAAIGAERQFKMAFGQKGYAPDLLPLQTGQRVNDLARDAAWFVQIQKEAGVTV